MVQVLRVSLEFTADEKRREEVGIGLRKSADFGFGIHSNCYPVSSFQSSLQGASWGAFEPLSAEQRSKIPAEKVGDEEVELCYRAAQKGQNPLKEGKFANWWKIQTAAESRRQRISDSAVPATARNVIDMVEYIRQQIIEEEAILASNLGNSREETLRFRQAKSEILSLEWMMCWLVLSYTVWTR